MRLKSGQIAPSFTMRDIYGQPVSLAAYRGRRVLLWFARAAACPLCDVRLWHLINRYPDYQRAGLSLIAFFESSDAIAHTYLDKLRSPFPIIADRARVAYSLYGLETSVLGTIRAPLIHGAVYREAEQRQLGVWKLLQNVLALDGKKARMPAEFLIGPDQRIQRAYYGRDAGDFLMFSEIEEFLARV